MKRIALGTDHAGFKLKKIKRYLETKGYEVIDYGTNSNEPVDYPDYIRPALQISLLTKNEIQSRIHDAGVISK